MKKGTVFVAGFVVGMLFIYIWSHIFTPKVEAPAIDTITEEVQDTKTGEGTTTGTTTTPITVTDQTAGDVVRVAVANMPKLGWLAVHEIKDGVIANALGASLRDKGEQKDINIYLLRPTVKGGEYAVVLYDDNGDRQFSLTSDSVATMPDGSFIMSKFKTK